MSVKVFEIQVSGISCTNCSKKILYNIPPNSELVKSISVNVLSEKVMVSLEEAQKLEDVLAKLKSLSFGISQTPYEIVLQNDKHQRSIFFNCKAFTPSLQIILNTLKETPGVRDLKIASQIDDSNQKLITVVYNPMIIKAKNIYEVLSQISDCKVEVHDPHLDCFKKKKMVHEHISLKDLLISLIVVVLYSIFAMVIPPIKSATDFMIYPREANIFSLYTITMMVVAVLILKRYGVPIFIISWKNFKNYRILNMETLITLGTISAILMVVYLSIVYAIDNGKNADSSSSMSNNNNNSNMTIEEEKVPFDKEARRMQIEMILQLLETATLIILIVNIGKYLEGKAKSSIIQMTEQIFPQESLEINQNMNFIEPKNRKFQIEEEKSYEISMLDRDDIVRIQAPMRLLIDGVIVYNNPENQLEVVDSVCFGWDEKFLPKIGERVRSGAEIIKGEGFLQIENTVEQCMLSKISNQLNLAQNESESKESGLTALFASLSKNFVQYVIVIAFFTMVVWIFIIGFGIYDSAKEYCLWCLPFEKAISVLVASCPCALGLAIPSVLVITLNLAMRNQILIKKNNIFEKIHRVNAVVFDKTGTLFTKIDGIKETVKITQPELPLTEAEIWEVIAILEKESKHPLAELLFKEAMSRGVNFIAQYFYLQEEVKLSKTGISATLQKVSNKQLYKANIGNYHMMIDNGVEVDEKVKEIVESASQLGRTCLYLSVDKRIQYIIQLDNTANLRPEAKAVVTYLQQELKKRVYILSGDAKSTVERVGEFLGVPKENLIGEADAESKKHLLRKIKEEYNSEVMMIGDGLNDILSIQEAAVGVSINAKSELNLIASDVVALNENLWKVASIFNLMQQARIFIICNLIWAFAYNFFMIPISAGVFHKFGFDVSPIVASAAMSGSSLVVVIFSNLMRCLSYDPSKRSKWKNFDKAQIEDISSRRQQTQRGNANSEQSEENMELQKIIVYK